MLCKAYQSDQLRRDRISKATAREAAELDQRSFIPCASAGTELGG
jgi:hypothetical protein